jgi:hypothetical protein
VHEEMTNMSVEQFKAQLVRDKLFLKELYLSKSSSRSKRLLYFASDPEIATLLKYLHFISIGEIKIKKANFEALRSYHLNAIKKNFEKKSKFQQVLRVSRKEKIKILSKFTSGFSHLLAPLFNENNV